MNCPNCGYEVTSAMKYCPDCGKKLEKLSTTGTRRESYTATSLRLNQIYADIEVSFNGQGQVTVEIDGDEEIKQAINLLCVQDTVMVDGKLPGVNVSENSSVSINHGRVKVDGTWLDESRKLRVKIILPLITKLEVAPFTFGSMLFMNDGGRLTLTNESMLDIQTRSFNSLIANINGMGNLKVGDVADGLTLGMNDMGSVTVERVNGMVAIYIYDSGNFEARHVRSDNLSITTTDMGGVVIDDVNIKIADFQIDGVGNTNIKRGSIGSLSVELTDMGDFTFRGKSSVGSFRTTDMGSIKVGSCDTVVRKKQEDMGTIKIG